MNISVVLIVLGVLLVGVGWFLESKYLGKYLGLSLAIAVAGGYCVIFALIIGAENLGAARDARRQEALETSYTELVQKVHNDVSQYGGISLGLYQEILQYNEEFKVESWSAYFIDLSDITLAVHSGHTPCPHCGDKVA